MAVIVQLTTVTAALAALNVPGVTVKDIGEIPIEGSARGAVIIPIPERFITDLSGVDASFGAASALKDLNYTLNYRLLYAPIGSADRATIGNYAGMVQAAVDFIEAVMGVGVLAGCVEIYVNGVLAFGPVSDPSGAIYNGCDFALRVHEFVQ